MPAPPTVPPLPFDLAAAGALADALSEASAALGALARADQDRLPAATADWRGSLRSVFDQRHVAAIGEVRRASALAAAAADEVRTRSVTAVAAQQRAVEEARLAADRDLARLGAVADQGARP